MIERHRPAFELWRRVHAFLEAAVPRERDISDPFARSLDFLFLQSFKSHGALYVLCVRGFGEDAATILRRMMEIAFQARYLCADISDRGSRGQRYLAWFWRQAVQVVKSGLPEEERRRWQGQYDAHKHLLVGPNSKPLKNWWGNSSIRDLAQLLGLAETYDQDYRFLSQMAHCTSQGILFRRRGNTVEIRTDILVPALLVYGTRYVLAVAGFWNAHFSLLDEDALSRCVDGARAFNLAPAYDHRVSRVTH